MAVQLPVTTSSVPAGSLSAVTRPLPSRVSIDDKKSYLDLLISQLSVEELGNFLHVMILQCAMLSIAAFQLPLISGNWIIGEASDHGLYGM